VIKPETSPAEPGRLHGPVASTLLWVATRQPRTWRILAGAILAVWSVIALFQASVVVDGTRHFWIDDDEMISMRYARNLVDGHGLVWNPGEHVEGYTNFLWTLAMAAIHLLPIADVHTAVLVRILNWLLALAVLFLAERLLRLLSPRPGLGLPVLLLTLAVDIDLVFWSVNGFESTLLTATFLLVLVRLLKEWETGRPTPATYVLLGLLPLIRSDAYHVWAGAALVAFGMSEDRRRTLRLLALALLLPAAHLLFRRWYYGAWLPNTYYLKVAGVPDRAELAVEYLARFAHNYGLLLAFAGIGIVRARDRRRWLLAGAFGVSAVYVLVVGEDLFDFSRFLAHLVPLLVVLGVVAAVDVTRERIVAQAFLLLSIWVSVFVVIGVTTPSALVDDNGEPESGLVTGVLIGRFTRPEATIAAVAAGNVAYFSHRYTVDMLGKSDAHIAHEPAHTGSWVGHNKYDPEYSLSLRPDLVVPFWLHKLVIDPFAIEQSAKGGDQYIVAIVTSPTFQRDYLPNPVKLPYLLEKNSVYIRSGSPELARRELWQEPVIGAAR
jgi:hypothetical protein